MLEKPSWKLSLCSECDYNPPLVGDVMITVLLLSYDYEKLLIDIVLEKISAKVLTNLRIIMNIVCFYLYFEVFIAECWQKCVKYASYSTFFSSFLISSGDIFSSIISNEYGLLLSFSAMRSACSLFFILI